MSIEFYYSPYCRACGADLIGSLKGNMQVRWIDITRHLEHAARLGITRVPALVIDGRLRAQGPRAIANLHAIAPHARQS